MSEEQQPSLEDIKKQCVFCQIADGQIPTRRVYEDDKLVTVLDINPANAGHMLVLTKDHFALMPQIPDPIIDHLGKISKELSRASLSSLKCEGTTVFIANGGAAGQRAPHFIMHVIPRVEGDGVGITLEEKKMKPEEFQKVHTILKQVIDKTFGIKSTPIQAESKKETPQTINNQPQTIDQKPQTKKRGRKPKTQATTNHGPQTTHNPSSQNSISDTDEEASLDDIAGLLSGK